MKRADAALFALYLLLPWLFFGLGVDVFRVPLAPGDSYVSGLPTKIFATTLSPWNPYIMTGTYAYKDIGFQALYPPAILIMSLFPNPFGYNVFILLHYSFAGFFTYLFLSRLELDRTASFWGGLVYMFSGFMTAHFGHYMIVTTAMYLPVLLYSLESFFVTRRFLYLFLSALSFTGSLLADYTAVSMYIGMVSFPYIIFRILATRNDFYLHRQVSKILWIVGISITTFLGGLIMASMQVFPILEALPYVTRQKSNFAFFSSFSFPIEQLPLLIFPYIFGGFTDFLGHSMEYFGKWNLPEMTGYVGILPLLMATLSITLLFKQEKQVQFWLLIAAGGFILVLGNSTPLYEFMYYIPGYNLFRAPARNWLEVNFSIAILSAFLIHNIRTNKTPPGKYTSAAHVVIGVFSIFILLTLTIWNRLFPDIDARWVEANRITSPSVLIPLCFFAIAVTSIYLLRLHNFRRSKLFWHLLTAFVFLDLFAFGYIFNVKNYPSLLFFQNQPHPILKYLSENNQSNQEYRILALEDFHGSEAELQPNLNMLYKISVVNGSANMWLSDYSRVTTFKADVAAGNIEELLTNNSILSLLSTKYLLTSNPRYKSLLDSLSETRNFYKKVHETADGISVYENLNFLPRARFIEKAQSMKNSRDAYFMIWENPDFDPLNTALVEEYRGDTLFPGRIISTDYSDYSRIKLIVETGEKSFLVLADSWYPGWKVFVDGKEHSLYKVYSIFRGVLIRGEGEHVVEFRFVPMSFYLGLGVSLVSTLLLFLAALALDRRKPQ